MGIVFLLDVVSSFGLYKNVPGEFDMKLFESAVKYFKG